MVKKNWEFWAALLAIAAITAVYGAVSRPAGRLPPASQLFGHGIGILGFILMLMTETLYSLRKRSTSARWGSMESWLKFHMFTGLVGSYMVLLHPAAKFQGLAGAVALLTVIVVISGLVGRYIYTAVPRTIEGTERDASDLEREIAQAEEVLEGQLAPAFGEDVTAPQAGAAPGNITAVLGRGWQDAWARWRDWRATRGLEDAARQEARDLQVLLRRRRVLRRQLATLATARRMLAAWHAVHVPIGVVLFVTALVHIVGAIYYATLLR